MDHGAGRGADEVADAVGDRVVDAEGGDGERPDAELTARLDRAQLGGIGQLVLAELDLHQAGGETGGVDRRAGDLGQHVRQRTGVVLVTVGEEDRPHPVPVLLEVGHVGNDEVDSQHFGLGKGQPAVDDHEVVPALDDGDVLADLADPAERDDAKGVCHGGS